MSACATAPNAISTCTTSRRWPEGSRADRGRTRGLFVCALLPTSGRNDADAELPGWVSCRGATRVTGSGRRLTAAMSAIPAMAGTILPKDPSLLQIKTAQTGLALDVVDPSGAVIPNASVLLVGGKTGSRVRATTDASGRVRMADLPSGTYWVEVSAGGFGTNWQEYVTVPVLAPIRVTLGEAPAMMGWVVGAEGPEPKASNVTGLIPTPVTAKPDLRKQADPLASRTPSVRHKTHRTNKIARKP